MRSLLFLLLIIVIASKVQIYPDQQYKQTTASSRACYANCQFCQIKTGFCEECLSPYFQKDDVTGNCVLITGYNIQSSLQQISGGQAFFPSTVSWSNTNTRTCSPDQGNFSSPLKILGPFGQDSGTITYQRSVSSHKYMKLKFFLLKMNWTEQDSLSIIIRDQANTVLSNDTLSYSSKIPRQKLCSQFYLDQRFSLSYEFQNTDASVLFISFVPNFKQKSSLWGVSTFLLLTGKCHSTCDNCFASIEPTKCKNCKNFFIQGVDGTCNMCADGFRKQTINGTTYKCEKCPIQYKTCDSNRQVCFYNYLSTQLNTDCKWNNKQNFASEYYVNTDDFTGSLFSVNGASSTYKCGQYSIVGLARRSESISRVFTSLKAHQSVSLTFNVLIVDQQNSQKSIFQIYIDNQLVENIFITTVGISSICAGTQKQVFQTYPATKFFPHTNTENVNITIRQSSNTSNWGIRNFRLSLHVCDESCLDCGQNGCRTCSNFFGLKNLSCEQCPSGASVAVNDASNCYECSDNCLSCFVQLVANDTRRTCTKCQAGYFIFEGQCQILPNVGQPVKQPPSQWKSPGPLFDGQCPMGFKSSQTNKLTSFLVAENTLTNTYTISEPHHKMLVSFYLIKIDNWSLTDQLHLYINDLLVMKKKFPEFGNRICYQELENDLVSFEQLQIQDNNQTFTAYFEVVSSNSAVKKKFGVANFAINPVACPDCQNYDFSYKVQYNYDEVLTVQIIFNRLYVNNDPDLFKKIFVLKVNGKILTYQNVRNDSIRYLIEAHPDSEVILSNITVLCKYPQKVTTDILDPINEDAFFQGRVMQQTQTNRLKSLSNSVSTVTIERFTPLDNPNNANGVRIFFEVVTRAVIYLGYASFFLGFVTSCTHFMHNIQKIWLHIYVASLTIPNFLKFALKGFRQSQDQNIAIHPTAWQKGIPEHLYYNAPAQYQEYYHDITFFRNIYNIGFASAVFLVFAIIMYFVTKSCGRSTMNWFFRHLKVTFNRRPYFVFNSVIFYQYITICIACTLQFIDLASNTNEDPFRGVNATAAIICFVLATAYPLIHFFYMSYKEKDMYSMGGLGQYQIAYRNRYHEIFYRFLPQNLWKVPNFQFKPIGFKQRFYNLLRFGQIWWFSIIFALMYGSPFAQAFLLMITNFLHLAFLWLSSLSYTRIFKILKVLELMFFVGLEIIILVAYQQNQTLTKDAYKALGIVGVVFIFVILGLSFVRFIYTLVKLIQQYKQRGNKQGKIDERLRNDDFYASIDEQNERVISEQ